MRQLKLLKTQSKSYGGSLRTKRNARGARPLAVKETMHLVLRSSKARGAWSFLRRKNYLAIEEILAKFAGRYGVKILNAANVGNHIHLQIQLGQRRSYRPFIRAITAAIAMAITGWSRWNKPAEDEKFWDQRPFTRVVVGFRARLGLKDYIAINRLEGSGIAREEARILVKSG